ncbi:hypothetical protein Clacol_007609 [Clathrus columnatus]|uniref:DH domain-containing protein n=1 Tax=Clathrus columnatus TaxID=1419009 RepID=A0AAV5AHX4_9AGAM|nr:hypothetical protein Clacol_007609 [Clathrus columnatus]
MQTLPGTHLVQRPSSTLERGCITYHALPKGAQPPQIPLRDDLPLYTPKSKNVKNVRNVLRRSSRSSSSTTITTTLSTTSSNNQSSDISYPPFHGHNDWNPPTGPGHDPLLDRLRYDISYPPPRNQPSLSNVEVEAHLGQFEKNTTRIQTSWSDSGHATREKTFSALFLSPSSSSSSSEGGHYDSVYRSQTQSPTHLHPRPLSYHLPSRVLNMGHAQSTISHGDHHSSVSHSTEPDLVRKPSSSWWKRSFRISDKSGHKEENLSGVGTLSAEPRSSRRPRIENNAIALSSSISESGHLFVISTEEMDTSPSRTRRKLRKKPHSPSAFPSSLRSSAPCVNGNTINQRIPSSSRPLPTPPVPPLANGIGQPQDRLHSGQALYNIGKHKRHDSTVTRHHRIHPNIQHQPYRTSADYAHSSHGEHPHSTSVPLNSGPTVAAVHGASGLPFPDMLPPLRVLSPLRIHIPLSESGRCKSAPDLTIKPSNRRSRDNSTTTPYPTLREQSYESETALVQSPISDSSTNGAFSLEESNQPSVVSPTRPSFLRTPSNRRWTLAVSETPEEELLAELERLRRVGWALGFQGELVKVRNEEERRSIDLNIETEAESRADGNGGQMSHPTPGNRSPNVKWRKEEMEQWLVARKALLVCREIVRTEKTYCEGLEMLQRGETLNTPPPLLLQYLPALISASRAFIARLAEDPSTWGVSAAFLGNEEALEAAFVAWSGVVGQFFGKDDNDGAKREIRNSKSKAKPSRRISLGLDRISLVQNLTPVIESSNKNTELHSGKSQPHLPVIPPVMSPPALTSPNHKSSMQTALWRRSMPSLALALLPGHGDTTNEYAKGTGSMAPDTFSFNASSVPRRSRYSILRFGNGTNHANGKKSYDTISTRKVPTVQDLAIQPVQRVVRYVLLYKDLFNSAPETSPARALAERALESASRIARRCNRAQDNAAFFL